MTIVLQKVGTMLSLSVDVVRLNCGSFFTICRFQSTYMQRLKKFSEKLTFGKQFFSTSSRYEGFIYPYALCI